MFVFFEAGYVIFLVLLKEDPFRVLGKGSEMNIIENKLRVKNLFSYLLSTNLKVNIPTCATQTFFNSF